MALLKNIKRNLSNIPGWRTNRKIVVIESDDWGGIRMPSMTSFEKLEKAGLDLRSLDAERYNLNDTLASSTDIERLFEVLAHFKDNAGNNPVFTAVSVVANPDFEKIRRADYNEYFYELFPETLMRYPGCERSFELWKEGIERRLFVPQLHGREHLNVISWMHALKKGDRQTRLAFEERMWGFIPDQLLLPNVDYQAAFLLAGQDELQHHKNVIVEALDIFEKLFGYKAEYFVPPNGLLNNSLNFILIQKGVKFRYATTIQHEPVAPGKMKKVFHWLGQQDDHGIKYIPRNCFFEPSKPGKDWVDNCLNDIKIAFCWQKPAIISTHRVNYMGTLNPQNRDHGLTQLKALLKSISKNWPDVRFKTTPELGKLIDINVL